MQQLTMVSCVFSFVCAFAAVPIWAKDLAMEYGQLPKYRAFSVSPDGAHYAYIERSKDEEFFVVFNAAEKRVVGGANASKLKARSVYFATNKHVILTVSETRSDIRFRGKWEQDTAVSYQIDTREMKPMLLKTNDLYLAQQGLSRIVGVNVEKNEVYMPAFIGQKNPQKNLLRADLNTGRSKTLARGKSYTVDWFVSADGKVLAREDFDASNATHKIWSYSKKKPYVIYEEDTDIPSISIQGITSDNRSLVYVENNSIGDAVRRISLADGTLSAPEFQQTDKDIDRLLLAGKHREYLGVALSGPIPEYHYLEPERQALMRGVSANFKDSSITTLSATQDNDAIIFKVSGNAGVDDYYLYRAGNRSMALIASGYPTIKPDHVGRISAIRYPARDATKLTAVLTWPAGFKKDTAQPALPTLVFPHGGPESYDRIRFDWWAQYFARKGYLVFQPNFRGSSGHGKDYMMAGRGQWGQLMQDDITDGVKLLIDAGYSDPDRVCIMGASFGGYSALAGAAFTPDLYRCAVSVAGVSDLPKMLQDERHYNSKNSWALTYWEELIGDARADRKQIAAVSPVNSARLVQAPVLLIHGKDDVVVRLNQSKRMAAALKKAGKKVELMTLKGEDHWLSGSDTRVATLKAIDAFLETHNPVDAGL